MITLEQAKIIAEKYLKDKNREYTSIGFDRIRHKENHEVGFGRYKDQQRNVFVVSCQDHGYQDPDVYFVYIDSETGEVLFTSGEHGYIEELEN